VSDWWVPPHGSLPFRTSWLRQRRRKPAGQRKRQSPFQPHRPELLVIPRPLPAGELSREPRPMAALGVSESLRTNDPRTDSNNGLNPMRLPPDPPSQSEGAQSGCTRFNPNHGHSRPPPQGRLVTPSADEPQLATSRVHLRRSPPEPADPSPPPCPPCQASLHALFACASP
jgi:hypothetical protein